MAKGLAIYGCGGMGREVFPIAKSAFDDIVFVSDVAAEQGRIVNGIPVASFDEIAAKPDDRLVAIAIGSGDARRQIAQRCEAAGLKFASVLAKTAAIYDNVTIGQGAVLCHNSLVTSDVTIGQHFQGNYYSYVAHDCVIGDFVTFAPRVSCNGHTVIEDDVYVGTGAVIKPGRSGKPLVIGKGSVIGMGAVVTKDVAPGSVVVGNPAREMFKSS